MAGLRVVPLALVALLVAAAPSPCARAQSAPPPDAPAAPTTATARITYITGTSIYLDAGRQEGLDVEDTVEVTREGETIATLRVAYLSEHSSSCTVVSTSAPPAVGDVARYVPRVLATGAAGAAAGPAGAGPSGAVTPPSAARTRFSGPGLHGRVGVRYLVVRDTGNADNGYTQPSVDLRLDGEGLGGSDFDVNVDIRARQTYRNWPGSEDQRLDRVYRMSTTYRFPDSRQRVTVGRQFAPNLEAVNIFDGAVYDMDGDRWGAGFFAGTQPDPADLSVDGTVREYGGYYLVHSRAPDAKQWAVTLGLIDSYAEGDVNREWFYVQGRYRGPRLNGFVTSEIDYNRSWKVSEAGESTISPTSTFATLHFRASDHVNLYAGYDNRRSARLYQDRITPATAFDDAYRQGGWAGASFRLGRHFGIGGDARVSTGGPAGRADGYSGNLGWEGIGGANLGFNLRTTRYGNDHSDGWLYTLNGGWDLGRRSRMDVSVGRVEETDTNDLALDRSDDWYGIDFNVLVGRNWFLILSWERYTGTFNDNDQGYAAVTYRF
jgi:hypothetical protein